MCLAVPAKIVELQNDDAVAELHGNLVRVSTVLVPGAAVGDWVLLHAGFAIQRLSEEDARETWAVLDDLTARQKGGVDAQQE